MKYVLRVYESKRDVNGNHYALAQLIDAATRECVYWDTANESSAISELQRAMGLDKGEDYGGFPAMVWIEPNQVVGLRELRRVRKQKLGVFFRDCKKAYDHLVYIVKQNLAEKEGN